MCDAHQIQLPLNLDHSGQLEVFLAAWEDPQLRQDLESLVSVAGHCELAPGVLSYCQYARATELGQQRLLQLLNEQKPDTAQPAWAG
jgi:hypothetical protein